MLIESFNFYSIITPIFMMVLGGMLAALHYLKPIPSYVVVYGYSTIMTSLTLFLYSILEARVLPYTAWFIGILLFISCALLNYSISLRLKVKTHWIFISLLILFSEILIVYYSLIENQHLIYLAVLAITPSLLFGYNLMAMYKLNLTNILDQILRFSLVLLIGIICIRMSSLILIPNPIHHFWLNNLLFASIQLLVLILSISLALLLLTCAFQDIFYKLRQELNLDPLTGLLNRRALAEQLKRFKYPNTVQHALLLCDLDHFKQINDQYGHQIGDLALCHVSNIMKNTPYYNKVARIGGEEFAILLHDCDQHTAIQLAEYIRSTIETSPLILDHIHITIHITISIGVSFFNEVHEFEQAMQSSDLLLYQAKKFGRNKVEWLFQP